MHAIGIPMQLNYCHNEQKDPSARNKSPRATQTLKENNTNRVAGRMR